MSQETALKHLFVTLERLGIPYMLTGSYASNIYGRLRSTFDADIVIALQAAQMKEMLRSLGEDFYVDAATLEEVGKAGGQFNAIHKPSGLKIDFYLPRSENDREALARRKTFALWETRVSVISPEDLILSKLVWAKEGGSGRQIEDARGVYELQRSSLDMDYMKSKADALSVRHALNSLISESK
ncbi:MAG: hypothetical protein NTX64_18855 [Elusimicrobia bacterium]|nr:hypothetical protein [Elusimicrobiota bacterium]